MNVWHESRYWLAAGWTMFHFLWVGALVWVAAALLRPRLSRAGPELRYAISLGLFLAIAGLPCGLFFEGLGAADQMKLAAAAIDSEERSRSSSSDDVAGRQPSNPSKAVESARRRDEPPEIVARRAPFRGMAVRHFGEWARLSYSWFPWLWLAGAPLTLAVLACGATGAERLRRGARLLEEDGLVATCRRLQAALRVGERVALAVCDRVSTPLLVGILRPIILLPPAVLAGCSPDQIEMILIHELAHVRRRDNLVNLVQRLIEALLFFHPAVWWLSLADYGNVYVNGMTPDEVKAVVEDHLSNFIDQPEVKVAVVGAAGR